MGLSEFTGNNKGYFSLRFKRQTRIKIINKNGLDAANIEIPLYVDGEAEEKLENLQATTYNLENGKVVETKLESSAVFKEKLSKKVSLRKFTLPAAKEGSVIEISYSILSDFLFNLQPWRFQGEHPCMWSEYEVHVPEFFQYVFISQGSSNFHINKQSEAYARWLVKAGANTAERSENINLDGRNVINRWVMKDVPVLKEEAYTSTLENHIAKVQFQLSAIQFPNSDRHDIMGTWPKVTEDLMKDEDFGAAINKNNNWLDDELNPVTAGAKTALEKVKAIYNYVQKNFTATSASGLQLTSPIKTVFKNKNGNVADINLLLVAMLRHQNIQADPIILSTKSHGYTHELYPILERFNYVIASAIVDDKQYLLDATNDDLSFGTLHWKCYNGHARLISEVAGTPPIYLDADSIKEQKYTSINIVNNENGKWVGTIQTQPGYYEAITIKEKIKENGQEAFFKKIKNSFSGDIVLKNETIESLKSDSGPLVIKYDVDLNLTADEDVLYFSPMLAEVYKENPFKSATRQYPVEMPYPMSEILVANIQIPNGYEVDELPKSTRVTLNETEGMFEYLFAKSEKSIQLRCSIKLNHANFLADQYNSLRDFFTYVVSKQSEQIVFKKKK
jgi:hypothetical protein